MNALLQLTPSGHMQQPWVFEVSHGHCSGEDHNHRSYPNREESFANCASMQQGGSCQLHVAAQLPIGVVTPSSRPLCGLPHVRSETPSTALLLCLPRSSIVR